MIHRDKNEMVLRARALRRELSLPEALLWRELRRRPEGLKFRRQHPIGRIVVDFYCAASRLVIEVDGEAHGRGDRPVSDAARDRSLAEQGFGVLRIPARDVLVDVGAVVRAVVSACRS